MSEGPQHFIVGLLFGIAIGFVLPIAYFGWTP